MENTETRVQQPTIGEIRMGMNPNDNPVVNQIKQKTAELITICDNLKYVEGRVANMAQEKYEIAAMLAVKAATAQK